MAKKAEVGKGKAGKSKPGKGKARKGKAVNHQRREWNWLDARGDRAVEGAGERPLMYTALGSQPQSGHPYNVYRDLMNSPKALADTLSAIRPQTARIASEIKKRGLSRVIATGMGTSQFAAMAAAPAFGAFADFDAEAIDCGEFLTSRRNWDLSRSALIVFSGSGRTFDANAAAKHAKEGGAYVVAMTSASDSPLTRIADAAVVCRGGFSTGGSDTFHYLTRSAAGMLLALDLGEKLKVKKVDFKGLRKQLAGVAPWLAKNLPALDARCRSIARQCAGARAFITVGGGPNLATAEEFALKLDEMAGIPSKAMCPDRFIHGALGLVDPGIVTAVIAPSSLSEHWLRQVAEATLGLKTPALGIVNESDTVISAMVDYVVRLPDLEENIFALAAALPAQLIPYHCALELGLNPDCQCSDIPRYARVWMKLFPAGSH